MHKRDSGSLDAAFELTKVKLLHVFKNFKTLYKLLYVFKTIGKKVIDSPKRKGASSRLRKDNAAGTFGDTTLCPNCWTVSGTLSQSILYNRAVSQELQDAILKGRVDSRTRSNVIYLQTRMQSFNFFFGIQLRVLVLRHRDNSSSTL